MGLALVKLLEMLRILETLREREIPLENEFMAFSCLWLGGDFPTTSEFLQNVKTYGETLIRFEEMDVFRTTFSAMQRQMVDESVASIGRKVEQLTKQMEANGCSLLSEEDTDP